MKTETATTARNIALIVPASKSSRTNAGDIKQAIDATIKDLAKADHPHIIHMIANGKLSTSYAQEAAAKHPAKITIKTHSPKANRRSRIGNRAIFRTVGNIAAIAEEVIILEGNERSITEPENDLINRITNAEKPKINVKISPTPTPKNAQPAKAALPLKESNFRININAKDKDGQPRYKTLQDVYKDIDSRIDPKIPPLYCGRQHKAKAAPRSPLANPYKDGEKAENIANYRIYLWKQIKNNDRAVMRLLRKITPQTPLICYCDNREQCHTDIIRSAAEYIQRQDAKAARKKATEAKRESRRKAKKAAEQAEAQRQREEQPYILVAVLRKRIDDLIIEYTEAAQAGSIDRATKTHILIKLANRQLFQAEVAEAKRQKAEQASKDQEQPETYRADIN